jgi:hypothetical protein
MLIFSVKSYNLSIKVSPSGLGSGSSALWFNQLEGSSSGCFSTVDLLNML